MKIAQVFFTAKIEWNESKPSSLVGQSFIPEKYADSTTPFFLVEIPISKSVLPVVLCIPTPSGGLYYNADVLDFSQVKEVGKFDEIGWEDHNGELFPIGRWFRDPPKHFVELVMASQELYRPLTSKPYAPKLLNLLKELPPDQKTDLLRTIGVRPTKKFREKIFICHRWREWALREATPQDREQDMESHGIPMKDDAIKKMASRLGFDSIRELRQ